VGAVGANVYLGAGVGTGRTAAFFQRHAQQRNGDLFARGKQHVQFARYRPVGDCAGQFQQPVGLAAHGGDDNDNVVTAIAPVDDLVGDGRNPIGITDRGAAVFLYDECHASSSSARKYGISMKKDGN
jgi:hypothetical protein